MEFSLKSIINWVTAADIKVESCLSLGGITRPLTETVMSAVGVLKGLYEFIYVYV